MTLVVSHGLDVAFSRYEEGVDDGMIRAGVVTSLVERGYSNLLREVVWREVGRTEGAAELRLVLAVA